MLIMIFDGKEKKMTKENIIDAWIKNLEGYDKEENVIGVDVEEFEELKQRIAEVLDEEFDEVEKGCPSEVASVVYVYKQVLKQKLIGGKRT